VAWTDCLLNPTSCLVENVAEAGANSAWESFLKWSARGLADFSATVFQAFSTSTAPRFDQKWWTDNLDLMVLVSLPLLVALFVLQCISAVVRREPGRLGHALVGSLIGTAGVPLAVGIVAACGKVVDEIAAAILGSHVTADGLKRMVDISAVLSVGTLGGFLLLAVLLALIALFSLYFVMLIREVALVAFVVFAPIAMASWTWSSTRHWLRRWVEVVGALLFSKIAMAVVFALGISATGASGQQATSSLGTFLAGILLVAMAAFAPLATFSFIHWAGDQGHTASHAMQQGTSGASAARDQVEQAQQWGADHFGGSDEDDSPIVEGDIANPDLENEASDSNDDSPMPSTDATASAETTTADPADSSGASPSVASSPAESGTEGSPRSLSPRRRSPSTGLLEVQEPPTGPGGDSARDEDQ
jgi:hypothetical protein